MPLTQTSLEAPRIKYDAEWLSILRESEPLMNYTRGFWNISANFNDKDQELRNEIISKLTDESDISQCPKIFDGSELNQTKFLRSKFLTCSSKWRSSETTNPEELELDLDF